MKSARSGSAAFGIVASAAIVSSGIVGGLLGGSTAADAAVSAAAPNACGQPPATTSALRSVPASQTTIVLDAATLSATKKPKATKSAKAKATGSASPSASASQSATAKPTASTTPSATAKATATAKASASASATATPKATSSATATPKASSSASASPSSSASASPSSSPSASPSKSASSSPSPSPTGSSPSPSPTGSSPSVQLCLEVQAITTKAGVHPGGTASYAIWVWPAGGAASGVTVTVTGKVASNDVAPKFTVCPTASGRTCKVGGIAKGTSDELQATIAVPSGTAAGKQAVLTATAKASDAATPPAADGSVKITAKPSASHSPSPSPTPTPTTTGTGVGATLPAGILPTVPSGTDPMASLGQLPAPTTSAGSPGGLFPTVSPQPSASPSRYSAVLPNARDVRVTDAAATFPFSTRLIGGEVIGLAVLAAALALAIVRFSLRRPRPQHGKDAAS